MSLHSDAKANVKAVRLFRMSLRLSRASHLTEIVDLYKSILIRSASRPVLVGAVGQCHRLLLLLLLLLMLLCTLLVLAAVAVARGRAGAYRCVLFRTINHDVPTRHVDSKVSSL